MYLKRLSDKKGGKERERKRETVHPSHSPDVQPVLGAERSQDSGFPSGFHTRDAGAKLLGPLPLLPKHFSRKLEREQSGWD